MRDDVTTQLDRTIATIEEMLRLQIAECQTMEHKPCSVSEFRDVVPRGLARLHALRQARAALGRLEVLARPDGCRREAARYAHGGSAWCAVPGNDRAARFRREGFVAAAADLDAILTRSVRGHTDHPVAA